MEITKYDKVYAECSSNLAQRMVAIEAKIKSAKDCYSDGDLLQTAVRLQSIEKDIRFEEILMNILDTCSGA